MASSPLLDTFKRGEANRELKLLAAQAAVALRAPEQLELLVMLAGDPDPEVVQTAANTLASVPVEKLSAALAGDVSGETRAHFAAQGIEPGGVAPTSDEPLVDASPAVEEAPADEEQQ